MADNDNTKTPEDTTVDNALDDPKCLPDDEVVSNFVKSAGDAKKVFDALPENTAKQKIFKAAMYVVISLSATLAVPCGSLAYSYGNEKAKRESETQKKKAEAENVRRKLQLDLLKQIIAVAKNAEFKDPKSVYRLGLIAAMVNENHAAFGIRLIDAEKTMKSMSDRLAPIAGLRRRLRESGILMADLGARYKEAKKEEKDLKKRIKEINTTLKKTRYIGAWRKKKLEKELTEKENELDHQKSQRTFYQERLVAEQKIRMYFSAELKRQEKILKDTIQQTATLRDNLKKKSAEVSRLAVKLEKESKATKETVAKFKAAMAEMEKAHGQAEQTNKRLRSELKSERQDNDGLKKMLKAYSKRLQLCKKNNIGGGGGGVGGRGSVGMSAPKPVRKRKTTTRRPPTMSVPRRRAASRAMSPAMKATRRYFKKRRALDGLFAK